MVKKFTIPFASQGDANDIPDTLQVDGKVSFTQGFGYDYERPYDDPQAKDIAREDMNGLFKAITSAVGELQALGASEWSSAISYPKGAIVYYEKDLYISQVDDNQNTPPQNWVSITSIANDSLKKAANLSDLTNKATARSNLGLGSSATLNKTDVLGTSTSLVATQKLVNDTKINLENSKQDKLEFVGRGKVMREGAFRLGTDIKGVNYDVGMPTWKPLNALQLREFSKEDPSGYRGAGIGVTGTSSATDLPRIFGINSAGHSEAYTDRNTTVDSNGFLRASGSKQALTTSDVTQSLGTSTSLVTSQKLVTDQLNSIKSSHGLGYGQKWVDVTSQRAKGTTYTNNTGKPIYISVTMGGGDGNANIFIDDVVVSSVDRSGASDTSVCAIIPIGSKYKATMSRGLSRWFELR